MGLDLGMEVSFLQQSPRGGAVAALPDGRMEAAPMFGRAGGAHCGGQGGDGACSDADNTVLRNFVRYSQIHPQGCLPTGNAVDIGPSGELAPCWLSVV